MIRIPTRTHILLVSVALAVVGLIVVGFAVLGLPGMPDIEQPSLHAARQPQAIPLTYTTAEPLHEPVSEPDELSASPRRLRTPAVTGPVVGEHPTLPPSPIETSATFIEPVHQFRLTHYLSTPAACERFRSLVASGRDWDPEVVLALAWRESNCNERLVSPTNDWGLLQLNATCWAGQANDGLPDVRSLPDGIEPVDLRCDGIHQSKPAAQWCYLAKEAAYDSGELPPSPCDAWLNPDVNIATAYELWLIQGWRPWCFNEVSRASAACQAARETL